MIPTTGGVTGFLAGRLWPLLKILAPAVLLYLLLIRKARPMATFTLDQLKSDVEKNYATLTIEVGDDDKIDSRNVLRMDSGTRDKLLNVLDELEKISKDEEMSQVEQVAKTTALTREALRIAAGKRGDDLMALVGDDDALVMEIMSKWTEETQAGEAENSSD